MMLPNERSVVEIDVTLSTTDGEMAVTLRAIKTPKGYKTSFLVPEARQGRFTLIQNTGDLAMNPLRSIRRVAEASPLTLTKHFFGKEVINVEDYEAV